MNDLEIDDRDEQIELLTDRINLMSERQAVDGDIIRILAAKVLKEQESAAEMQMLQSKMISMQAEEIALYREAAGVLHQYIVDSGICLNAPVNEPIH